LRESVVDWHSRSWARALLPGQDNLFTCEYGLSSDEVYVLFEDREGRIWGAHPRVSIDFVSGRSCRFRWNKDCPAPGDIRLGGATGASGSEWRMRSIDGRKDGRRFIGGEQCWVARDTIESLFEDERGRIRVSRTRGFAAFEKRRFTAHRGSLAGLRMRSPATTAVAGGSVYRLLQIMTV
jgi:hypothetical protein